MRDLIITLIVFGALPFVLRKPSNGVLLWSWLGYMNPHRFTWGFAYTIPFAQIVAGATILGLLFSKEEKKFPWTPVTIVLILFIVWVGISTLFAIEQAEATVKLIKVLKIQLMTFITLLVMADRQRLHMLVWVIVVSIGFFGVKGGIFTILTGGQHYILGPPRSFIAGNTEIGLALVMSLPLMRYLQLNTLNKWVVRGLTAAILFTVIAIIATYSRGALLALGAMGFFLLIKSRHKTLLVIAAILSLPIILSMMPDKWFDKMDTIENYESNLSANQRLLAWEFGFKMGMSRLTGGGFGCYNKGENYLYYAPEVVEKGRDLGLADHLIFQSAHSIYFGVLGEHGFIGLALFLLLGLLWWRSARFVIRHAKKRDDLKWAADLAAMIQTSLIGYAAGGAFLSLEYFDLVYHLIAITVLVRVLVERTLSEELLDKAPGLNSRGTGID